MIKNKDTSSHDKDKQEASYIELYQGKPSDNQKFEVCNMLLGDSVIKYFCVKTYHNRNVSMYFKDKITEQIKNLGDVLHIKVANIDNEKALCDGSDINLEPGCSVKDIKKDLEYNFVAY